MIQRTLHLTYKAARRIAIAAVGVVIYLSSRRDVDALLQEADHVGDNPSGAADGETPSAPPTNAAALQLPGAAAVAPDGVN